MPSFEGKKEGYGLNRESGAETLGLRLLMNIQLNLVKWDMDKKETSIIENISEVSTICTHAF